MNSTGWQRGLTVTGGGTGVVSHAGVALIRSLADNTGLTAGLSAALAGDRLLTHDRGRVLADLVPIPRLRVQCRVAGRLANRRHPAGLAQAHRSRRRPGQGRAQGSALPCPARCRPPGTRRPAPAAENRRHLALGQPDRRRLDTHRRPRAPALTTRQRVPCQRTSHLEERGTSGHPARQPGHCHARALQSRSTTQPARHHAPAIRPRA